MDVIVLQSGSNGNCFFVASGGTQLVIDAGISGSQAERRLHDHGYEIRESAALLITHDHRDHAQNLGIYHRKFRLPVHITEPTLRQVRRWCNLGNLGEGVRHFRPGDSIGFGPLTVTSIPTPHDGVDGVAFVISDGQHRVGILTDLGHEFDGLRDVLRSLDAVVIESNYDEQMLEQGPYSPGLKQRIRGPGGHLSNRETAELLRSAGENLRWACLCHLSAENNHPHLALETSRELVRESVELYVSHRDRATGVMRL